MISEVNSISSSSNILSPNSNFFSYENLMDYTSRVLSLNENSKMNLMTFLDQYKEENTSLSKENANKVVMNYLFLILSDSNNYKHTSYYA